MKKYRIIQLESRDPRYTTYCVQKRFFLFWWIGLDSNGNYETCFSPTYYYKTLYEARIAMRKFDVKEIVIEE